MAAAKKKAIKEEGIDLNQYIEYIKGVVMTPLNVLPGYLAEKKSLNELFKMVAVVNLLTFIGVIIGDYLTPIPFTGMTLGNLGFGFVLQHAIVIYLGICLGPIVATYVMPEIDKSLLKLNYSKERWAKIFVFTSLPYMAAGALYAIPNSGALLQGLAGLYSLYLLFATLTKIRKVPQDLAIKGLLAYVITIMLVYSIFLGPIYNTFYDAAVNSAFGPYGY